MIKVRIISIILIVCLFPVSVLSAQKVMTTYVWDSDINAQVTETISLPNANTKILDASAGAIVSVLNTTGLSSYIGPETYWDSKCGWSTWTVIQNLNLVNDPENPSCKIRSLIIPLKASSTLALRETWQNYGAVNYDVQVKMSWFYDLQYALSGLNIRWRESSTAGKYEGYGVSFLYFNSQTGCSGNLDYIPHSIKPLSSNSLRRQLLLVLWQQKVAGGIETRNWLAYAVLDDAKITGGQSTYESDTMTDNVTLVVRVEDVKSGAQRFNDIKIYYGEASNSTTARGFDTVATNIYRGAYPPKCSSNLFPKWPSNTLERFSNSDLTAHFWSYSPWYGGIPYLTGNIVTPVNRLASDGFPHTYRCTTPGTTSLNQPVWPTATGASIGDGSAVWRENGTSRPSTYDYFTLLSTDPKGTNNAVKMYINPALVNNYNESDLSKSVYLRSDRSTLRTTDFALTDYPSGKPEIALHGMGNITGSAWWWFNNISRGVAFTDLAIQTLGKRE